jgi:integrase
MLSTGIRRSEAAHIMWDDFCSDGLRIHGKGNKERIVPVPPFIVGAVYQACLGRKGEMVFGVGGDGIAAVLRKASREAGIPIVTPHDLRRTFATRALRQLPVVVVQKLMGHSSPTTTAGYDRTRLDELTEMVRGTDLWSV